MPAPRRQGFTSNRWMRRALAASVLALTTAGCAMALGVETAPNRAEPSAETPAPAVIAALEPATPASPATPETTLGATARHSEPSAAPLPGSLASRSRPPGSAPYRIPDDESHPAVKEAAVRAVEALTNYDVGTEPGDIAAAVTTDPARHADLVDALGPLHAAGMWSTGHIIYPQLGGLRPDSASVMVVVERRLGVGSTVELTESRTLDVRLVNHGTGWSFDHLASTGGEPVARPPDLAPEAASVVDDPRIELPDSAVWDIYRGGISLDLLRLMADLADQTPYGVVVLTSGHPIHVYATDRTSRHTVGRAVDVYRIDQRTVSSDREVDSSTYRLVSWLYDHDGLASIGAPWALDGRGGRSFTDAVHQDHLHLSVAS